MLRKIYFLLLTFLPLIAFSQNDVEMADTFRSEGKIYIVIAIIAVIFIGLIIYLVSIDRKLKKLEERIKKNVMRNP
jgi:CcmD family protein